MEISDKMVAEFKEIYQKTHHKEMNDADARESARNLLGFVNLLWEMSIKDQKRKARLKKEPDGFPVDSQYSCLLCGSSINEPSANPRDYSRPSDLHSHRTDV